MTETMNPSTATPAEIDGCIVSLKREFASLESLREIHVYMLGLDHISTTERGDREQKLKALNGRIEELATQLRSLHDEYIRRGTWTRYYLVTNNNGHVHTSTDCNTCFDSTEFGWLTQFSGTDHDEMGRLSGMDACARCFPGLPAEIMKAKRDARVDTPERIAVREQAAAEKAAKAAKAVAKAIANPDGSPLMLPDYMGRPQEVKTEVAASRRVMEAAYDLKLYPASEDAPALKQGIEDGLAALAHKRGTTVEAERAALTKKVEAKYRRESK